MSDLVASVRAKELNLMLYDLARDRDIAIVDADDTGCDARRAASFAGRRPSKRTRASDCFASKSLGSSTTIG